MFYAAINAGSLLSTFISPILREDVSCLGSFSSRSKPVGSGQDRTRTNKFWRSRPRLKGDLWPVHDENIIKTVKIVILSLFAYPLV